MSNRFKKISYPGRNPVKKSAVETEILQRLRSFLDANEPGMVGLLVNTWQTQGKAITYKELREAILAGKISIEYLEDWQHDYALFVVEHMQPAWEKAITLAAKAIEEKYPEWSFDPMGRGVSEWLKNRAAVFVTNTAETQISGLSAVIRRAAELEGMSVDGLARAIRPMVGLTAQQSGANLKYYKNLIDNGISEKKAQDLSLRYAARQHRYRAYNIARTELAYAYNQGSYEGTRQAQEAGYIGDVYKVWCTADDERVCEICGPLEGKAIALNEDFDFQTRLIRAGYSTVRRVPPAHPSCRCSVMYTEVAPPRKKTG